VVRNASLRTEASSKLVTGSTRKRSSIRRSSSVLSIGCEHWTVATTVFSSGSTGSSLKAKSVICAENAGVASGSS
jgi:hypothetical protein